MGLKNGGLRAGGLRNVSSVAGLPASAVMHWPHNEGSGTSLSETVGTYGDQNGTINGATWVSDTDYWDDNYLSYRIDDYTLTGDWGTFWADNLDTGHTIIVEAAVQSGDDGYAIGGQDTDTRIYGIGARSFAGSQDGDWGIGYQDDSANLLQVGTSSTYDDDSRHFFAISVTSLAASDIDIYVDTGFVSTTTASDDGPSVESISVDVAFGASNDRGTPSAYADIDIGRIMVTDKALSESELDDIASRHGFSP